MTNEETLLLLRVVPVPAVHAADSGERVSAQPLAVLEVPMMKTNPLTPALSPDGGEGVK